LPKTSKRAHATRIRAQARSVDIHVGRRIRDRRSEQGLNQKEVARALGVTFQQVQKYESGTNRVSASRLFDLSQILEVQIQHFFEGLENQQRNHQQSPKNIAHLMKSNTLELVNAYYKVDNLHVRRQILSTIRLISIND